jgi:hypothetical protein
MSLQIAVTTTRAQGTRVVPWQARGFFTLKLWHTFTSRAAFSILAESGEQMPVFSSREPPKGGERRWCAL